MTDLTDLASQICLVMPLNKSSTVELAKVVILSCAQNGKTALDFVDAAGHAGTREALGVAQKKQVAAMLPVCIQAGHAALEPRMLDRRWHSSLMPIHLNPLTKVSEG